MSARTGLLSTKNCVTDCGNRVSTIQLLIFRKGPGYGVMLMFNQLKMRNILTQTKNSHVKSLETP